MNELLRGWSLSTINDLIGFDGLFSDGDWVESKDQDPEGNNRLLQLADIGDGCFINKSNRFVNDEQFSMLRCTELKANDVLVARMPDPLGRACLMPVLSQRCLTVVDVAIIRPGKVSASPKWLMYFLNAPQIREEIHIQSTGTTRKRIARGKLAEMRLPVPPLAEQKRIAEKLDTLLARVDATRARLDRIPTILKRFRQSVLAAATSGQLTEDWRQEQSAKASVVPVAPVHHGSDSDLPPPKGRVGTITWEWVETDIQSVAAVGTGSTPLRSNIAYFSKTGTPWITSSATSQRLVKVSEEYVTDEAIRAHRLKVYPKGTLLIAMYGEGKTRGQVTELGIPATINQACAAIIVDENKAIKSYVKLALQANYLEMRDMAEGGNQPNLNLSKIKGFPLSLPSINEQIEIVRRVEMIFGFVEELQEKYASAHFKIERLVPALLAKAFRGELVPQDPNDEPAEQLLARIQESRDVAPPTSKRGRKKI